MNQWPLGNSLAREIHGEYVSYVDCDGERAGARACEVTDVNGAGSATWRVELGSRGCWKARRTSPAGPTETPQPEHTSGCAWLRDYVWVGIPDEFD